MEQNKLPNATAVLVLGIFSIIGCCCYGVGIIPGIIGLILAKKDMKEYHENPELYSNYSNLNIGRILSIIGICICAVYIIVLAYMLIAVGPEGLEEWRMKLEDMQRNQ
jgi:hypothetical protein